MGDILTRTDLKTALRITDTEQDVELDQIIDRMESRFQGAIGQKLLSTTATEKYTGDNQRALILRRWPIVTLTSATVENESAIDVANTNVIRFETGPGPVNSGGTPAILTLVYRLWSYDSIRPLNVTIVYAAGHSAIKNDLPEVWELILDASTQLHSDMETVRKGGVSAQGFMGGSISYYTQRLFSGPFGKERWDPLVQKHSRRPMLMTAGTQVASR